MPASPGGTPAPSLRWSSSACDRCCSRGARYCPPPHLAPPAAAPGPARQLRRREAGTTGRGRELGRAREPPLPSRRGTAGRWTPRRRRGATGGAAPAEGGATAGRTVGRAADGRPWRRIGGGGGLPAGVGVGETEGKREEEGPRAREITFRCVWRTPQRTANANCNCDCECEGQEAGMWWWRQRGVRRIGDAWSRTRRLVTESLCCLPRFLFTLYAARQLLRPLFVFFFSITKMKSTWYPVTSSRFQLTVRTRAVNR